jgi:c-di-GMP-binding flagellar brake protein YcgR
MRCRCEGAGFKINGFIVDISYGGAGIVENKELPAQGTELLLTIRLPGKIVELRSRVVWTKLDTKEPGLADFGVEFLDSLQVRQEKLAQFFPQSNTIEA